MSEQNKDVVRRVNKELYNQKKLELFDQLYHPDFRQTGPGSSEVYDVNGLRENRKILFASFPDFHVESLDLITEGDSVVQIWRAQGTFKADYLGFPANNKQISWAGVTVHHFHDGKIAEIITGHDNLEGAQLMGIVPTVVPATG